MNRETGWIALDELIPNDGERLLLQGEAVHVEGFYEARASSGQASKTCILEK